MEIKKKVTVTIGVCGRGVMGCGELCPVELSQPPRMRIIVLETIYCSDRKGGGDSSGEYPESFSETAFIGISMCRDIQHTCIAHQSISKGYSYKKKLILSVDDN